MSCFPSPSDFSAKTPAGFNESALEICTKAGLDFATVAFAHPLKLPALLARYFRDYQASEPLPDEIDQPGHYLFSNE
jgi:hypothetical protein